MQHNNDNTGKKAKSWYHPKRMLDHARKVEYVSQGGSSLLSGLEKFIPVVERLQTNLGFISLFITILGLPIHLYNTLYGLIWSKESHYNRATRVVFGVASIALTAVSIIAAVGVIVGASTILMMVGAAKGLVESIWKTGIAIYDRFFGRGAAIRQEINAIRHAIKKDGQLTDDRIDRLTKLTNQQRKGNQQIANGLHVIAMNVIGIIAVGLLFSGVTAAAGTGILVGIGIYGAADAVGLNPFSWAGRGINWASRKIRGKPLFDPFTPKTRNEVRADLLNELTKNQSFAIKYEKAQIIPHSNANLIHNSESHIISELHKKAAPLTPLTVPEKEYIQKSHSANQPHFTSFLDKKTVASSDLQKPSAKQDEDEGEGEHEHPHPSNSKQ